MDCSAFMWLIRNKKIQENPILSKFTALHVNNTEILTHNKDIIPYKKLHILTVATLKCCVIILDVLYMHVTIIT